MCLFLWMGLRTLLWQNPKKEINRSPFRHTESYKQSREKINTLQETEQGSTEESGAEAPILHIQSAFKNIRYAVVL